MFWTYLFFATFILQILLSLTWYIATGSRKPRCYQQRHGRRHVGSGTVDTDSGLAASTLPGSWHATLPCLQTFTHGLTSGILKLSRNKVSSNQLSHRHTRDFVNNLKLMVVWLHRWSEVHQTIVSEWAFWIHHHLVWHWKHMLTFGLDLD